MASLFPYTAVGACDAIREEATRLLGENAPMNLGRSNGALDYMATPQLGSDIQKEVVSPDGETIATMRLLYDQPTRACQASTDPNTNICNDTTTTTTRKQAFVEIDKKISSPARQFTVADMAVLCDPDKNTFIRQRLMSDLRATRERWDEIILAEMSARRGKIYHFDGTTTAAGSNKDIQLLDSNNTQQPDQDLPLAGNFVNMILDYQKMKFSGVPAIVAEGLFHKFMTLQKLACCNSAIPYEDAVAQSGVQYFYDQAANSVLGSAGVPLVSTNLVMLVPGALHLLTYQKNNIIKINTDLEAHTVVPDPVVPGIYWNLDFKWDCTTETWKYMYSTHWTLFNAFQSDSFALDTGTPDCGDDLTSVTGVFGYRVTRG